MKIDRRITNGLAWTGALLVVAIPSADFISRQFMPDAGSNVAVVSEAAVRAPAATAPAPATVPVAATAPKAEAPAAAQTAQNGDVVSSYLQSGKALPDYITGGGGEAAPAAKPETKPTPAPAPKPVEQPAAKPKPAEPVATAPVATPAQPVAPSQTAVAPAPKAVGFPTPASERPAPVAVAATPPLIIDAPTIPPTTTRTVISPSNNRVIRPEELDDMEEWEAGPINDFLAQQGSRATVRRQQVVPPSAIVPPANVGGGHDFVPGGFFFDQGPANTQPRSFPRAYDDGFYPEYEVIPLN